MICGIRCARTLGLARSLSFFSICSPSRWLPHRTWNGVAGTGKSKPLRFLSDGHGGPEENIDYCKNRQAPQSFSQAPSDCGAQGWRAHVQPAETLLSQRNTRTSYSFYLYSSLHKSPQMSRTDNKHAQPRTHHVSQLKRVRSLPRGAHQFAATYQKQTNHRNVCSCAHKHKYIGSQVLAKHVRGPGLDAQIHT